MRIVSLVFAILLVFSMALAGTIDPQLQEKISSAAPNAYLPTLIFMSDQLDVAAMKHRHDIAQATLAQRHYEVITNLQNIAASSQADLLAYLADRHSQGKVGDYRGYWITNMIYAQITSDEIRAIASRDDVARIYSDFEGHIIQPVTDYQSDDLPSIQRVEVGLRAVKADSAWLMGYTGMGRLVCNIDTGVDGDHPAYNYRWRGANGYTPQESWLDTSNPSSEFPTDYGQHGSHTMGTLCGRSVTSPDTIGVAIDAQWIAAAAIEVTGGNVATAFQWAADPDGDPNTMEDVPDVISNSWGAPGAGCPPDYYNLMDNCEAAGAAIVFAAGNDGPGAQTIGTPANRITTPYNCMAVGAVDGSNINYPIAGFSSRGPSQCDGQTIKPEVVAPGVNVRSSVPGGGYQGTGWSGTSMACPHVAGAIAILRQVNPNATVDTLKWALMQTARDLGSQGEDNTYGMGIIDIKAAIELVPAVDAPYIFSSGTYVDEPNDNYPDPGETISLFVRLRNSGLTASNVAAIISSLNPNATINQDSCYFGTIAQNDTALSATGFDITFSPETPLGSRVNFMVAITADGGYQVSRQIGLMVGRPAEMAIMTHNVGNVAFTISNFGQYGLSSTGMNPNWPGQGFKMPRNGSNNLFEGGLLIGDGPTRVSNGVRDQDQAIADDFMPLSDIDSLQPGPYADQEYHCQYNDQGALIPLGVQVTQRTYAFANAPDNDYVIIEYQIKNTSDSSLNGVLVAHFEDWDIPNANPTDRVNFDRARKLGYQYSSSTYRGQQVLSDAGIFSFKALDNTNEVYPPHFTMEDKWNYMNAGTTDTAITSPMDASIMITTGPYDIAPGDSIKAVFSILGGTSLTDIRTNSDAAITRYALMTIADDNNSQLPDNFMLNQNYPNPFNANTIIRFNLPSESAAKLDVFDLLGRHVVTLIDTRLNAGVHSLVWSADRVSSGVYFYKLSTPDKTEIRKMILIR